MGAVTAVSMKSSHWRLLVALLILTATYAGARSISVWLPSSCASESSTFASRLCLKYNLPWATCTRFHERVREACQAASTSHDASPPSSLNMSVTLSTGEGGDWTMAVDVTPGIKIELPGLPTTHAICESLAKTTLADFVDNPFSYLEGILEFQALHPRAPRDDNFWWHVSSSLSKVSQHYANDESVHTGLRVAFTNRVHSHPLLATHRRLVAERRYGFGEDAFSWLWKLVVDAMPSSFSMLEIGVFKGQSTSLVQLLSNLQRKSATIYGICPLDSSTSGPAHTTDAAALLTRGEYLAGITDLYSSFGMDPSSLHIIQGLSTDAHVLAAARSLPLFDILYIDGGHRYEVAASDIEKYTPRLRPGGLLLIDDSASFLRMHSSWWAGLAEVSLAVDERLPPLGRNPQYQHLLAMVHLRVWRKLY